MHLIRCITISVSRTFTHRQQNGGTNSLPAAAGIGTYTSDGKAVSSSWLGKLKSSFSKTIDEGLATSFESHVCSGYRFLMRYYGPGDRIYIFGFSRGAFTARFLARMVSEVGLLSMGNEELVPFAYQKYQEYVLGQYTAHIDSSGAEPTEQQKSEHAKYLEQKQYLNNFKITFCRHEGDHKHDSKHGSNQEQCGIKPHFLGLFDTVSSVGTLDVPFTRTIKLSQVGGTAEHIRHAVAIDEHRVKFKVALLEQDIIDGNVMEDVKEVWFPGNHGDVGGGWSATKNAETEGPTKDVEEDSYQLSDIALKWMIEELDDLPGDKPEWNDRYNVFMDQFDYGSVKYEEAIKAPIHNTMSLKDSSWYKVLMWWFLGTFPFLPPHPEILLRRSLQLTLLTFIRVFPSDQAMGIFLGQQWHQRSLEVRSLSCEQGRRPRYPSGRQLPPLRSRSYEERSEIQAHQRRVHNRHRG
jgi:hypothetical protein